MEYLEITDSNCKMYSRQLEHTVEASDDKIMPVS